MDCITGSRNLPLLGELIHRLCTFLGVTTEKLGHKGPRFLHCSPLISHTVHHISGMMKDSWINLRIPPIFFRTHSKKDDFWRFAWTAPQELNRFRSSRASSSIMATALINQTKLTMHHYWRVWHAPLLVRKHQKGRNRRNRKLSWRWKCFIYWTMWINNLIWRSMKPEWPDEVELEFRCFLLLK